MSRWQVEALKEIQWESDEIGSQAIENSHYLTDIHSTILHQMGLDGGSMKVPGHNRIEKDYGHIISDILSLK